MGVGLWLRIPLPLGLTYFLSIMGPKRIDNPFWVLFYFLENEAKSCITIRIECLRTAIVFVTEFWVIFYAIEFNE